MRTLIAILIVTVAGCTGHSEVNLPLSAVEAALLRGGTVIATASGWGPGSGDGTENTSEPTTNACERQGGYLVGGQCTMP
jgi:hypothetical protein